MSDKFREALERRNLERPAEMATARRELADAIVAVMFELNGPVARQFQIIRDRVYAQEAEITRLRAALVQYGIKCQSDETHDDGA